MKNGKAVPVNNVPAKRTLPDKVASSTGQKTVEKNNPNQPAAGRGANHGSIESKKSSDNLHTLLGTAAAIAKDTNTVTKNGAKPNIANTSKTHPETKVSSGKKSTKPTKNPKKPAETKVTKSNEYNSATVEEIDATAAVKVENDSTEKIKTVQTKAKSPSKNTKTGSAAKKPATVTATNEDKTVKAVPQSVGRAWTPKKKDAACVIQRAVRGFLARRALAKLKKDKQEYLQLMDKLEKEAYVKMVRMYQEEAERERKKEEEEKRKRQQEIQRHKQILTAAFDGDIDVIESLIRELKSFCLSSHKRDDKHFTADVERVRKDSSSLGPAIADRKLLQLIDCEDANGNTPLSEAAAAGYANIIQRLIELGAEPNSKGRFSRTPLYRAAFAGNIEAVQALLRSGGDPRLYAEDGMTPAQICSFDPVCNLLNNWDIQMTDRILQQVEAGKQTRKEAELKHVQAESDKLKKNIEKTESEYNMCQKRLCKATGELEKRIREHDMAASTGFEKLHITEQSIKDGEKELELRREELEKVRERLAALKLELRDQRSTVTAGLRGCTDDSVTVKIKELDDVLMRDVGDRIKTSGKWPLLIDTSGRAATFLRYRDTNYINALSPHETRPDNIRISLLGALRYGKYFVLDMMEVDMFDAMTSRFNEVQAGLLAAILNKSILTEACYFKLIRPADGSDYSRNTFTRDRLERFKFIIVTKNSIPSSQLLQAMYTICVQAPT